MTQLELAPVDLAGLLEHLVDRISGAETAILLTVDGQATTSGGAALPSTLRALAEVAGRYQRLGPVWRTVVALDHQLFALASAGPDAVFGVTLTGPATLDSVLDDTATAAEHAGRALAAHGAGVGPGVGPGFEARLDEPAWSTASRTAGPLQRRRKHRRSVEPYPPGHPARGTAPVTPTAPGRPAGGSQPAQTGLPPSIACDPSQLSDDQLERMLARLRSL